MSTSSPAAAADLVPLDPARRDALARVEGRTSYEWSGFRVEVHYHTDTTRPMSAARLAQTANVNQGCTFLLPTQTVYEVHVVDTQRNSDQYFTVASFLVGDKSVIINNGTSIFYGGRVVVQSFDNSRSGALFRFVATSAAERASGAVSGQLMADHNKSNVITMRLVRWKLKPPPEPQYYFGRSLKTVSRFAELEDTQERCDMLSLGFGCKPVAASDEGEIGYSSATISFGAKSGAKASAREAVSSRRTPSFGGGHATSVTPPRLLGGSTQSAPGPASLTPTVFTTDGFLEYGPVVELKVQLACPQTDAECAIDNARVNLHRMGFDRLVSDLSELNHRMNRIQDTPAWKAMPLAWRDAPSQWELYGVDDPVLDDPDQMVAPMEIVSDLE
jgi:hypothetical protein